MKRVCHFLFVNLLVSLILPTAAMAQVIVGPGPGGLPDVQLIEPGGTRTVPVLDPAFLGGLSVALGDVNGDGTVDIIAGAGPGGGPQVRVLSGTDLGELANFYAFDPSFTGGVRVAAGDVNGDGRADIIMGAGAGGGPHVRVFSGLDFSELASFYAYPAFFTGGVTVAAGDVNGDGRADIVTGAGAGGGPHVRVFSGLDLSELASFYAYDADFVGGVSVAAGDFDGDGLSDIATGAGPGGGPHVRVFSGLDLGDLANFYGFDPGFAGGVQVAAGDIDGDGRVDLILGAGPGGGGHVRILSGVDFSELESFFAPPSMGNGISVGSVGDLPGVRFTSAAATTFTVGSAGSFTVTTAGNPVPTLTSSGALPAGVTFVDNGDGTATLAGTPAAGSGGDYVLTFNADNGGPSPATQSFTLNVHQVPAITSAAATTFPIGAPGTFAVTTSGFPLPAIARSGATLPDGITWVDNGNGTGTLGGTPAPGTAGSYAISFTATNAAGTSAPQAFTLTIHDGPGFTSATSTAFTVGSLGTFTVTTVGTPTASITATALPGGVQFVDHGNGTGTLSGTPDAGTAGAHAITFTATNTSGSTTQAFTLTVRQAPAITSAPSTTFTVGVAGSFTVTTSGFPAPSLTRGGVALPAGILFVDNGNGTGTLSGTPAAGTGGSYAITFTATNVVGSTAPQPFTLTVSGPPSITSANAMTFTVGAPGTFTVTSIGSPTPALTVSGSLPAGVTFVDNGNGTGTLSGTPAAGTAGSYALTFTAANGTLPNAVQAFTLTVQQAPAITSAASTTFTVGTPGTFTVTTTGFPTPTVSQSGTLPTGVTFTPATRVLGGTAVQTGAFPLVFTATNSVPPDATQNFTLNVVCPAITVNPATMPDGLFQIAYAGVTFTQTGSTGSSITWSATGLPAGLAISPTTGVVSGTPTNTVLNGVVSVTATDNFLCTGTRNTTITVRPVAGNDTYTGGVGNTQFVVGAAVATPAVSVASNVEVNDNGPGALTVVFGATSVNGGTIAEGGTDGTFVYTPALAFAGPSDTFTYTLTDGNLVTNTGTVTINLSNIVWYVNSAGGAGDGRSHNPFNTLNAAATPSGSTHIIYVHSGGATTPGNLTMDANQTLHGAGATFSLNSLTIPAGSRPTLTGTVTLADNTTVRAVNFTPSAIPAMTASGVSFAQPVTIDQVNVTGGTSALSLTNVTATATGAINVSNASFTNTSAAEVLISQGTIPVTLASTAIISSNAGRSVDIQNRTGGTVTFNGPITDTGQGVHLNANPGTTINFTGGLSLSTTTNPGFTATGGGTVSATQNNTTIVNTITTTTGTGLNVANTTIGASGLTFRSIAANGAANGILLNNTGTTAGVTVTGDGNITQGGNASGGLIQNTTGVGISLTNAAHVSFNNMHLNFTGSHGVNGTGVMNFSFTNGKINEAGTTGVSDESCVSFDDLNAANVRGTFTFTNSQCTLTEANGIDIENWGTTLSDVTISGNLFTDKGDVATPGSAVLLIGNSSASTSGVVTKATLTNNTITDFRAGAGFVLQANADAAGANPVTYGTAGSATNVIAVTGNFMNGGNGGIGNQPDRFVTGGINRSGQGNYNVSNNGTAANRIRNIDCIAIELQADGPVTVTTTVQNNFINANSAVGCAGIAIGTDDPADAGAGTHTTTISGNNVMGTDGPGIYAIVRDSGSTMRATIINNTVAAPIATNAARAGIRADSGSAQGNTTLCLQISGNTTAGSTNTATATTSPGINLRKQGTVATTNVFGIVGLSPSPTGTPTVENHVNGLNTSTSGTFGVGGTALLSGTSGFVSCVIP